MISAEAEKYRANKRRWYEKNKERQKQISHDWHFANRERRNAHRHLLRLRKMKDPRHSHVRKMIELAAKFPKKRIVLSD